MNTRSIGVTGEDIAASFLQTKGYTIVSRNFRSKFGEIDIIAQDGKCIVFCEVKMRKSEYFGIPAEAITKSKLRKIIITSELYLKLHARNNQEFRIDAVEIIGTREEYDIRHIINITL